MVLVQQEHNHYRIVKYLSSLGLFYILIVESILVTIISTSIVLIVLTTLKYIM